MTKQIGIECTVLYCVGNKNCSIVEVLPEVGHNRKVGNVNLGN